jgi:hypothetical protein
MPTVSKFRISDFGFRISGQPTGAPIAGGGAMENPKSEIRNPKS